MNKLFIIGNLTADPETRTTATGKFVSTFTVAVNRNGIDGADYFRVSAWGKLGELCKQYLAKGRKVGVTGSIRAGAYVNSDCKPIGTLELMADEIEFLSPRTDGAQSENKAPVNAPAVGGGFVQVNEELPF